MPRINTDSEEYKFGQQIRKYRVLKNMSQDELAECANTSRVDISKIENGFRDKLKIEMLVRLSRALNVPLSVLLDSDDEFEQIMWTIKLLNSENRRIVQIAANALLQTQAAVREKAAEIKMFQNRTKTAGKCSIPDTDNLKNKD